VLIDCLEGEIQSSRISRVSVVWATPHEKIGPNRTIYSKNPLNNGLFPLTACTMRALSRAGMPAPHLFRRRCIYLPARKNLPVVASTTPWPLESPGEVPYLIPHTNSLFLPSQSSE
jgi:hypothetical protein